MSGRDSKSKGRARLNWEVQPVPTATYKLFEKAMRTRKPVVCIYDGYPRAVCPIILGHSDGAEKSLTYQFGGTSSDGPVFGDWKCFSLAKVGDAEITDGPWRSGDSHKASQTCVKEVDLDINPNSPFNPKRRLRPN
jgi:hypothetical protein